MNQDFKDLLSIFCDRNVEFLVVGAHALAAHGHIRATKDLDIWIRPTPENGGRVIAALREFGAPLQGLTSEDLSSPGVIFQIGVPPVRIDIITIVDGLTFEEAFSDRLQTAFAGVPVGVLSRKHLIQNKRAAARLQDLADIEALSNLPPSQPTK